MIFDILPSLPEISESTPSRGDSLHRITPHDESSLEEQPLNDGFDETILFNCDLSLFPVHQLITMGAVESSNLSLRFHVARPPNAANALLGELKSPIKR